MARDKIELKSLNPNAIQLLRFCTDPTIRLIVSYGGSSSGKSYGIAQVLLMMTFVEGGNSLVMRKVGASISKSLFEDFRQAMEQLGIDRFMTVRHSSYRILNNVTGAKIDFCGLDDPEKIKGISNYRWVFMDEWNEYDLVDFKQIRKRLRGRKGQQIITAFNPVSEGHWIKTEVFDKEEWRDLSMSVTIAGQRIPDELTKVKSVKTNSPKPMMNPRTGEIETHAPDTVLIQSTYLHNFWVVGSPDGTYGYYDEQCVADFEKDRVGDPDYYNVYALGEWGVIRTGAEFFPSFNRGKDCRAVPYDPTLPIHVSVDKNRLPYISYTFWQVDHSDGIRLRQFHEICAKSPDNSARKSAALVVAYLRSIGYADLVHLHGDCTTRNGSTEDDEGRSFLDKVISTLTENEYEVVDKIGRSNPSVPMSGEFINAVWDGELEGLSIVIGEDCKTSIDDYQSVQKDSNGAILKTKVKDKVTMQTYEKHGHLSDTLRYVVVDVMNARYVGFSNRRKRNLFARDGLVRFFNPGADCEYTEDLVYCIPNAGGKFVMVHGRKCADKWHIADVAFFETSSTEDIKERLNRVSRQTYVEAPKSYYPFIRELRDEVDYAVGVVPEGGDVDRRIAATSDFVKTRVLFDAAKANGDGEYSAFVASLLDYNQDGDKEASAALSGFCKIAAKLFGGD